MAITICCDTCYFCTDIELTSDTNPAHCPECGGVLLLTAMGERSDVPLYVDGEINPTLLGDEEETDYGLVCGCQIQYDNSGVGHNWRDIASDDINADVRLAIEAEIIDGKITECDDWTGPDGQHYRWSEA